MSAIMALPLLSFLFLFMVLPFIISTTSQSLPFVVLHGIGNQCSSSEVNRFTEQLIVFSGARGYCIEVGDGSWDSWFMPMLEQIQIVCEKVNNMTELRDGYNIVAFSQGNLIGRGVVEFCEGGPPVKNFISLGGPHAGISSVPYCGLGKLCTTADNIIKNEIYSDFAQEHLAPSGYTKIPNDIPAYLEKSRFLPLLNNERPYQRNAIYKERFGSLQNLVLIMFENDTVLVPKETSWFGFYPEGFFEPVLSPQETKLYIEDWIGLRSLDEAGRVHFISVPGRHVEIQDNDVKKYVVPYLNNQLQGEVHSNKNATTLSMTRRVVDDQQGVEIIEDEQVVPQINNGGGGRRRRSINHVVGRSGWIIIILVAYIIQFNSMQRPDYNTLQ